MSRPSLESFVHFALHFFQPCPEQVDSKAALMTALPARLFLSGSRRLIAGKPSPPWRLPDPFSLQRPWMAAAHRSATIGSAFRAI